MQLDSRVLRYWHTVRYLKPVQVYGRLWFKLHRPRGGSNGAGVGLRARGGAWTEPIAKRPSLIGPERFSLCGEQHEIAGPRDWNNPLWDKLWLYHLHYFDDLNAAGAEERTARHLALLGRWLAENPAGRGNGWEPYPLSLRIVNWIKWALRGNAPDRRLLAALGEQAGFLRRRLEVHLLGNHLLANAKALVFSGLFLEGKGPDEWLRTGLRILDRELPEQVLEDGGQFERSPMYHAIILEDLLDLVNGSRAQAAALPPARRRRTEAAWTETARRMLAWLRVMCHPDGDIALFNDAALEVAAAPADLEAYARRLGIEPAAVAEADCVRLRDSGYIRVRKGEFTALLDVAPLGPDYLPGHGHADTLGFELSIGRRRVIVDTGTGCYGTGPERLRQRATAAHNTVTVDGLDSSEVWGGFRVARRARPLDLEVREAGNEVRVACSHDGYRRLPGRVTHRRRWLIDDRRLVVLDSLSGRFTEAVARFHLHPEVAAEIEGPNSGRLILPGGKVMHWHCDGGTASLETSTYHPRFGVAFPNQCLELRFTRSQASTVFTTAP